MKLKFFWKKIVEVDTSIKEGRWRLADVDSSKRRYMVIADGFWDEGKGISRTHALEMVGTLFALSEEDYGTIPDKFRRMETMLTIEMNGMSVHLPSIGVNSYLSFKKLSGDQHGVS